VFKQKTRQWKVYSICASAIIPHLPQTLGLILIKKVLLEEMRRRSDSFCMKELIRKYLKKKVEMYFSEVNIGI